MKHFLLLFVAVTAILTSCDNRISKKEMLDYVDNPSNKLVKTVNVNGIIYTLKYRPTDLIIDQFLSGNNMTKNEQIDSLRTLFKNHIYFKLCISFNQQEILHSLRYSKRLFGRTLNQLAFEMDDKMFLTNNQNDTIPLIDYSYSRTFGKSNGDELLFVFGDAENKIEEELRLSLKEFGLGSGDLKFRFSKKDIEKLPSMDFE